LPLVRAAFSHGELSYAKVRAVTRVATAANEQELLELARACTAAQLERAVRAFRRVTTAEACELQEQAYLSVFWEPDGSLELRGRLAPEDGALLVRALEAMRDSLWKQRRGSAEPRPARQASNAEALVVLADAALAHRGDGRPAGERYQVVVHADESALSQDDGGCQLADGSALAPETARRLACDASLVRNGRRTRTIPPALRRALRARDSGCRFPGCEHRRFLDAHHLHHWARGGPTTLSNLVLLCRRHHRLVHEGGWQLDRRLRFHDPRGRPLPTVPSLPRGQPGELLDRHSELGIDATTYQPGDGRPMDVRARRGLPARDLAACRLAAYGLSQEQPRAQVLLVLRLLVGQADEPVAEDRAVELGHVGMVDLDEVAPRVAKVHLHLAARQLVELREAAALVEGARGGDAPEGLLEVVDLHPEVLAPVARLVGLVEVELEVPEPQPADGHAEVRRGEPVHPERLRPPALGRVDVGDRDAHVVQSQRAHAGTMIVR
jgi:hypothetical protein